MARAQVADPSADDRRPERAGSAGPRRFGGNVVGAVTLALGTVGGVLGALVAIPLAGALRVIALRLVAPAIRRTGSAGDGR